MGGGGDILGGAGNLIGEIGDHISYSVWTLRCDPKLRSLAWSGGPTSTHALRAGSCAIDAGGIQSWWNYDQRGAGHPRWIGAQVDIGAYEYDPNDIDYDLILADGLD